MANNLIVKDASNTTQTVKTTDNSGVHTPHHNIDTLPALPAGSNTIGNVGITGTVPLPTGAAQDGTDGTGITPPTGAAGIRGWLSGIYNKLATSIAVTGTVAVTGVATAAKQPALGTAGSSSTDVITMQGITGGTPLPVRTLGVAAVAADTASGTNAAATLTYAAAGVGISHLLHQFSWSYNGVPSGGRLTVSDGATVIKDYDITAAGPGFIAFNPPLKGTANTALTVTLYAGGSGVVGKINAQRGTE